MDEEDCYQTVSSLDPIGPIRLRPDMYIGDCGVRGLHHLVAGLIYPIFSRRAVPFDRFAAGAVVCLNRDGSVSVSVDVFQVEPSRLRAAPVRDVARLFSELRLTPETEVFEYVAANALSESLTVQITRETRSYRIQFGGGRLLGQVVESPADSSDYACQITIKPDAEIFAGVIIDRTRFADRLRELACFSPGARYRLIDEADDWGRDFIAPRGVADHEIFETSAAGCVPETPFRVTATVAAARVSVPVELDAAFRFGPASAARRTTYCNRAETRLHGSHWQGFQCALTRALNEHARRSRRLAQAGKVYCNHLVGVVHIYYPEPLLESSCRVRVEDPALAGAVYSACLPRLREYFRTNPNVAGAILDMVGSGIDSPGPFTTCE